MLAQQSGNDGFSHDAAADKRQAAVAERICIVHLLDTLDSKCSDDVQVQHRKQAGTKGSVHRTVTLAVFGYIVAPTQVVRRGAMLGKIALLLISALLLSQGVNSSSGKAPPYEDQEAYEVYSAILPLEWPLRDAHAKSLIIQSETKGYKMCLRPEKEWEEKVGACDF